MIALLNDCLYNAANISGTCRQGVQLGPSYNAVQTWLSTRMRNSLVSAGCAFKATVLLSACLLHKETMHSNQYGSSALEQLNYCNAVLSTRILCSPSSVFAPSQRGPLPPRDRGSRWEGAKSPLETGLQHDITNIETFMQSGNYSNADDVIKTTTTSGAVETGQSLDIGQLFVSSLLWQC